MITLSLVIAGAVVLYGLGYFSCGTQGRNLAVLLAVATLAFAPSLVAQQAAPRSAQEPQGAMRAFDGATLTAGLKATPGCLGVELARTQSGKQVIFAWFENKQSLMAWYTSDTHIHAMQLVFPGHQPSASALKDLPENTPVMAIASVTPSNPAAAAPGAPPFSQISIELYTPLAGGLAVGGRFAPSALVVPGLRERPLATIATAGK